jgi:hypothetical protein
MISNGYCVNANPSAGKPRQGVLTEYIGSAAPPPKVTFVTELPIPDINL